MQFLSQSQLDLLNNWIDVCLHALTSTINSEIKELKIAGENCFWFVYFSRWTAAERNLNLNRWWKFKVINRWKIQDSISVSTMSISHWAVFISTQLFIRLVYTQSVFSAPKSESDSSTCLLQNNFLHLHAISFLLVILSVWKEIEKREERRERRGREKQKKNLLVFFDKSLNFRLLLLLWIDNIQYTRYKTASYRSWNCCWLYQYILTKRIERNICLRERNQFFIS